MFSEKLKELVGETDKLEMLDSLMVEADSMETKIAEHEATIEALNTRISDLQRENNALFLRLHDTAPDAEVEEEKTPDDLIDELFQEGE